MNAPLLEVRHLRLVRAIADEGGPTRAAARLHLSQSAISHQLAELEGRLGVPLFARVRRRLCPTPAGARLIEEARTILAELARVERDLHRGGERKREVLRVVTEVFTSYYWLPPIVAAFRREAPHVDIRVTLEATRDPVGALLRGTVDLAIVSSPTHDRSLAATPLFADEWTVIIPRGHPLTPRRWVSVTELAKEVLFAHEAPRHDVERLRDLVAEERAPMPRIVSVPLTDTLVDLVKAGLGVGLVSRWAVLPHVERGEIETRRFTRGGLAEQWVALARRDAGSSNTSVQRFIELTRESPALPVANARTAGVRRTRTPRA